MFQIVYWDAPTLDFYVKTRCKTSNGAGYKRAETNCFREGFKKKLAFSNSFGDPLVGLSNWLLFVPPVVGGKATFF